MISFATTTVDAIKSVWDGFATIGGLLVSRWRTGSDAAAVREATTQTISIFVGLFDPVIRGQFLTYATDPGDPDPFDPTNASKTPAPGRLSALGENTYFTTRGGQTSAVGSVVLANASGSNFGPLFLDFKSTTADSQGRGFPTYTSDAAVFVPAGATAVSVPITCDTPGSFGTRTDNSVTTLVTGLPGVTVTQPGPILGSDRESADLYRERCRLSPHRLALNATVRGIKYYAAKNIDGTPLETAPGVAVNIAKVYVTSDSTTSGVNAFYAAAAATASPGDVAAANANMVANFVDIALGSTIFAGTAATEAHVAVAGSVEIKRGTNGLSDGDLTSAVQLALAEAVESGTGYFALTPIGGYDQVAGAGFVYAVDLIPSLAAAYPGVYRPSVTLGGTTAASVPYGNVAVPDTATASWTVNLR